MSRWRIKRSGLGNYKNVDITTLSQERNVNNNEYYKLACIRTRISNSFLLLLLLRVRFQSRKSSYEKLSVLRMGTLRINVEEFWDNQVLRRYVRVVWKYVFLRWPLAFWKVSKHQLLKFDKHSKVGKDFGKLLSRSLEERGIKRAFHKSNSTHDRNIFKQLDWE